MNDFLRGTPPLWQAREKKQGSRPSDWTSSPSLAVVSPRSVNSNQEVSCSTPLSTSLSLHCQEEVLIGNGSKRGNKLKVSLHHASDERDEGSFGKDGLAPSCKDSAHPENPHSEISPKLAGSSVDNVECSSMQEGLQENILSLSHLDNVTINMASIEPGCVSQAKLSHQHKAQSDWDLAKNYLGSGSNQRLVMPSQPMFNLALQENLTKSGRKRRGDVVGHLFLKKPKVSLDKASLSPEVPLSLLFNIRNGESVAGARKKAWVFHEG